MSSARASGPSQRYSLNRKRSSELFDLLSETAYYTRPIALRHPIVFYEGHLPAFSFKHAREEDARRCRHRPVPRNIVRSWHRPG